MSINLIVRIRVNYTILVQKRFYVSDFVFHGSQYIFGYTIDVDLFANLFVAKMYIHILAEDRDLSPCKGQERWFSRIYIEISATNSVGSRIEGKHFKQENLGNFVSFFVILLLSVVSFHYNQENLLSFVSWCDLSVYYLYWVFITIKKIIAFLFLSVMISVICCRFLLSSRES